jgi:hypothetical protein
VTGGIYNLNMVDVADDGAIYACNLTTDGNGFKIYRWADDLATTLPTTAYTGAPLATRVGDSFDVRGAGTSTQILIGARNSSSDYRFAIFTTVDGSVFTSNVFAPPTTEVTAFGLGVAFGEGNTVWGKAVGVGLTYASFDLSNGGSALIHYFEPASFPSNVGPIGVDAGTGTLIGIGRENSDNVRTYDLPVPFPTTSPTSLTLLDQDFYFTDNDNLNGTGAVAIKGNKVFALDSYNGIAAYTLTKSLPVQAEIKTVTYDVATAQITFILHGEVNATYRIEHSPDLTTGTWTSDGTELLNVQDKSITRTATAVSGRIFFRAVRLP